MKINVETFTVVKKNKADADNLTNPFSLRYDHIRDQVIYLTKNKGIQLLDSNTLEKKSIIDFDDVKDIVVSNYKPNSFYFPTSEKVIEYDIVLNKVVCSFNEYRKNINSIIEFENYIICAGDNLIIVDIRLNQLLGIF